MKTTRFNASFQLVQAAQVLSSYKIPVSSRFEPPYLWGEAEWEGLCCLPYKDRIAKSIEFLKEESERLALLEGAGLDPAKITEEDIERIKRS